MKISDASLTIIWTDSAPTTHCKQRRWSTRLICAWPTKPIQAGKIAPAFFAVAARAMRQILVNYAKSYRSQKRGGGALEKIEIGRSGARLAGGIKGNC